MKILAVSHACVVDVNQRVFRELERRGHSLTIIVPERWRHLLASRGIRPARLEGFAGRMIMRRVWKSGSIPLHGYLARPGRILGQVRPDLVYIEEEPYSVAAFQWAITCRRAKIPVLFYSAQNIVKRYPLPIRWMEKIVWRSSRAAVAVSEEAAGTLRERGYRGELHVVPLSVDLSAFRPLPKDPWLKGTLRLRPRVVAYFGRFVKQKGIAVLLNAYERLRGRADTSLLLVGGGPLETVCRGRDGVSVVTGVAHDQVPRYLSLADVVVLPSLTSSGWKEQFGRVVIEALACGVPVVGSNSGEIQRLVRHTGGGLLVPQGDAVGLANALDTLLANERQRQELVKQGQAIVRACYSSRRVASDLESVLVAAVRDR